MEKYYPPLGNELQYPDADLVSKPKRSKKEPKELKILVHCTHTPEKDKIWSDKDKEAYFKGYPKLPRLHFTTKRGKRIIRVGSYRVLPDSEHGHNVKTKYRQYDIKACSSCWAGTLTCASCCASISTHLPRSTRDQYRKIAEWTCKARPPPKGMCCLQDRCMMIEPVLPGCYVWFGSMTEKEEINATYSANGPWGFGIKFWDILQAYKEHHSCLLKEIQFRLGGTFKYYSEIMYTIIVTVEYDNVHGDKEYPIIQPGTMGALNLDQIVNDHGIPNFVPDKYPTFTMSHITTEDTSDRGVWEHASFAFHCPTGGFVVAGNLLLEGHPIEVDHNRCQKYKKFTFSAMEKCQDDEKKYKRQRAKKTISRSHSF